MGAVNLDDIESRLDGTLSSLSPTLHDLLDAVVGELLDLAVGWMERDGRRTPDVVGPASDFLLGDDGTSPRREVGGFAAGMGELDADLLALGRAFLS